MFLRPTISLFVKSKSTSTYPRSTSQHWNLVSRVFSTTGFTIIPASETAEEEHWAWYTPQSFHPVRISDVLHSKYRVLYKRGGGTTATTWMRRDLW